MTGPIQPGWPGVALGILGSGQLGRMFALAAREMGYSVVVYGPGDDSPAGQVATRSIVADYDDHEALERFAREVSVVSFEFENVPAETAAVCARHAHVRPGGALLHTVQHRLREKRALRELGLPVTPFASIERPEDLAPALESTGARGVLKTATSGYDGKGQARVDGAAQLEAAWRSLESVPCVLEALVDFHCELSIIGARGVDGEIALYEPVLNHHANHILDLTLAPAPIPDSVRAEAESLARTVLEGFAVEGVLCVELFLTRQNELLINELAPRPHNSGHLTIDTHATSQFEQQVRAVCGLPLGSTERVAPAAGMANLLGELWQAGDPDWSRALEDPRVKLHLYGKSEPRVGRKMGHLTATGADLEQVENLLRNARSAVQPAGSRPH